MCIGVGSVGGSRIAIVVTLLTGCVAELPQAEAPPAATTFQTLRSDAKPEAEAVVQLRSEQEGAQPAAEQPPAVKPLTWKGYATVRYQVVGTNCSDSNTGWWMDGKQGYLEIDGDNVSLDFAGFPPMTGTVSGTSGDIGGEMAFMGLEELVFCNIAGKIAIADTRVSGTVTERLTGGLDCTTRGKFTVELP